MKSYLDGALIRFPRITLSFLGALYGVIIANIVTLQLNDGLITACQVENVRKLPWCSAVSMLGEPMVAGLQGGLTIVLVSILAKDLISFQKQARQSYYATSVMIAVLIANWYAYRT